MGGGAGGGDGAGAKIQINVGGAEEAKGLFGGLIDTIQKLGRQGKELAEGPFKKMWDTFREGQASAGSLAGAFRALTEATKGPLGYITAGITLWSIYKLKAYEAAEATVALYKEVRQLQATAGGSLEDVQALQNAFRLMGVPAETLTLAMFRLGAAIETDSIALRRLGVAVRDTSGTLKEPIAVFEELRDKISRIGSDAERSATLREVLGRQGARLAPIFKADKAVFDEYIKTGREMAAIDDELAEKTVELMQSAGRLELEQKKLNAQLAEQVGIPMKEWWEGVERAIYRTLNAMLTHDAYLAKRRAFAAKEGFGAMGRFVAGWSPDVQAAVESQELAGRLEKQQKAATDKAATYTKEQMKEDETSLKHTREMSALRLKARGEETAEAAKLATGMASRATEARIEELSERTADENENYEARLGILRKFFKGMTDEQVLGQKEAQTLARDHEKRLLEINIEGQKLRRKAEQERVKEAEQLGERVLKVEETFASVRLKQIEEQEAVELARIDDGGQDKAEAIERGERVREESTRRAAEVRAAALNAEIATWTKLASEYRDNADVQVKANEKIMAASAKRLDVEMDTNRKIIENRKGMIDKLRQQETERAGIGATLEEKAVQSLKKQGVTQITSDMVKLEASRLMAWGEYYAKAYDMGGALTEEQFGMAREYQGVAKGLRKTGLGTGATGTARAIGLAEQERGAAYGFRVSPEEMISGAGVSATDVAKVFAEIPKQTKQALEDIEKMLTSNETGGRNLANMITDMIVRKLELDAQRQA